MDKDAVVTDKEVREFANKKFAEVPDELFWRILWLLFLFDSGAVLDDITDKQVQDIKFFYREALLSELERGEEK